MRASRSLTTGLLAAIVLACGIDVSAHRLDEFLQAARIAIESNRVRLELSLTPGIAMADGLFREIDANRDGALSSSEQLDYAAHVLGGITLRIDGASPLRLKLTATNFPDLESMRTGDGVISIQSEAEVPGLPIGAHHLVFRNDSSAEGSVYLANALLPDDEGIVVTQQARDVDQRGLAIDFMTDASRWQAMWLGIASLLMLSAVLTRGRYARVNM